MKKTKAVALQYDSATRQAPTVTASGEGVIAQKIIQKAQEHNVALFSNPELVTSLLNVEIDSEIPAQLYQAVAEVFGWLMRQESNHSK
jgi:flagellar biosynthesis protein